MSVESTPELLSLTQARLPTRYGDFVARIYNDPVSAGDHVALVCGDVAAGGSAAQDLAAGDLAPLVRLHSECLTGDVFGSRRCDCGEQLDNALGQIAAEGRGVLLYLRQEGRGIGLVNKIRAYALQDDGLDTVEANHHLGFPDDLRDYDFAVTMLKDLGLDTLRLLTNNPRKMTALTERGLTIVERVSLEIASNVENARYLATKRSKMGHLLAP